VIATMTSAFYPPYLGARLAATHDLLSGGRSGINLVTAHNDRAAQNFGLDRHFEHDARYAMASEWMEVVDKLWRSWEPDAIRADVEEGVFADGSKVHEINYEGEYYRCRGPLNLPPGPQGRPVACQAGGSPAGRGFAAKHADTIIALVGTVVQAKAYKIDIQEKLAECGRAPDSCKIMFCVSVTLGETVGEARERKARRAAACAAEIESRLASLSFFGQRDLSKLPLDEPFVAAETNASRTMVEAYAAKGRTLREIAADPDVNGIPFVGTPDSVADEMIEAMTEIGRDGLLFTEPLSRRNTAEITDGLIPALQRRGATRKSYASGSTLRDTLMEF
jgi:FMN-dependent oxidoreductase (nitrilotriacetate monooxygenase family)